MKKFFIEGMNCQHCQARVKNAIESFEGTDNVEVDLEGGFAQFSGNADDKSIIDSIKDAGYDVVKIEHID